MNVQTIKHTITEDTHHLMNPQTNNQTTTKDMSHLTNPPPVNQTTTKDMHHFVNPASNFQPTLQTVLRKKTTMRSVTRCIYLVKTRLFSDCSFRMRQTPINTRLKSRKLNT